MINSNSDQSSFIKSTESPTESVDFLVFVIWITTPFNVFLGRQLILSGGREFLMELSLGTQYLIGLPSLRVVSILSIAVLIGAATIHRHKARCLFMNIAFATGILVVIVYLVYCFGPAMTALHRLG